MQILSVSVNKIRELPSNMFVCWPRLQVLDVSDNHLSVLPTDGLDAIALRELQVSNNQLTALPGALLTHFMRRTHRSYWVSCVAAEITESEALDLLCATGNRLSGKPPRAKSIAVFDEDGLTVQLQLS